MRKMVLPLICGLFIFGCKSFNNSPIAPDSGNTSGTINLSSWKPCVIVQTPGFVGAPELNLQMEAVRRLKNAGRVTWVRLGHLELNGDGKAYAVQAKSMSLKVFGLIDLIQLDRDSSWENAFDKFYATFPEVDIWQIAGEISNPGSNVVGSTAEEYMPKFMKLYSYVKKNHPSAVITNAPPAGTGADGAIELEKFFEMGLLDTDAVVTMNIYSPYALSKFSVVMDKYATKLAGKRIWVTETGSNNPENHVAWVSDFYPRLLNSTRAEMVCWYALWAGDDFGDHGFSLINGISKGNLTEGTLFKSLIGGNQ